jgi:protein TonB
VKAQALAQSTLAGGGEANEGMVKSPLPDSGETGDGDALVAAQRQVQVLEQEQAALLAALKSPSTPITALGTNRNFNPTPGTAQDTTSEAFMRQVAALDKQVQDYNSRPRRKQLSPATKEAAFAAYYSQWSERLEKLGTENYPEKARGKSGEVVVTVSIKPNGRLVSAEVMRSSGDRDLDRAALRLLQQLAPYQPFWGELKDRVDILDITTRLIFTPGQTLRAETAVGRR